MYKMLRVISVKEKTPQLIGKLEFWSRLDLVNYLGIMVSKEFENPEDFYRGIKSQFGVKQLELGVDFDTTFTTNRIIVDENGQVVPIKEFRDELMAICDLPLLMSTFRQTQGLGLTGKATPSEISHYSGLLLENDLMKKSFGLIRVAKIEIATNQLDYEKLISDLKSKKVQIRSKQCAPYMNDIGLHKEDILEELHTVPAHLSRNLSESQRILLRQTSRSWKDTTKAYKPWKKKCRTKGKVHKANRADSSWYELEDIAEYLEEPQEIAI